MDNQKFYDFIRKIASDDAILAESIIGGHQSIYDPDALAEGFGDRLKQGAKGAALAAMIAAGGAYANPSVESKPSISQEQMDPSAVINKAHSFINLISNDMLESDDYDVMTLDSFKHANEYYDQLFTQDQNSANLFARVMNATLNKQLGVAPAIGKQMAN